MFYLEKVIAVIDSRSYEKELRILEASLEKEGIAFRCFWMDEGGVGLVTPRELLNTACLWMTDVSELVKALCQEQQPVLAFLHEENRSQDFSGALYACERVDELDGEYMDGVYRRCRRLPWDIVETKRCFVRETIPEDTEKFYEIYKESSITRYTEGLFAEVEQERQYINDYIDHVYRFYGFGVWTILCKETGEVIGRAGFSYRDGSEDPEIGFVIGKPWQRQGYAEEVCRAILDYGRQQLQFTRVQALVHPENKASLALCRKLGMQPAREVMTAGERHVCMLLKLQDAYAS